MSLAAHVLSEPFRRAEALTSSGVSRHSSHAQNTCNLGIPRPATVMMPFYLPSKSVKVKVLTSPSRLQQAQLHSQTAPVLVVVRTSLSPRPAKAQSSRARGGASGCSLSQLHLPAPLGAPAGLQTALSPQLQHLTRYCTSRRFPHTHHPQSSSPSPSLSKGLSKAPRLVSRFPTILDTRIKFFSSSIP